MPPSFTRAHLASSSSRVADGPNHHQRIMIRLSVGGSPKRRLSSILVIQVRLKPPFTAQGGASLGGPGAPEGASASAARSADARIRIPGCLRLSFVVLKKSNVSMLLLVISSGVPRMISWPRTSILPRRPASIERAPRGSVSAASCAPGVDGQVAEVERVPQDDGLRRRRCGRTACSCSAATGR